MATTTPDVRAGGRSILERSPSARRADPTFRRVLTVVAGLILAIMILPIVSAISREVISTVPADLKEASLALGATRWEMIRIAVLPYSRAGIVGASMLGLG